MFCAPVLNYWNCALRTSLFGLAGAGAGAGAVSGADAGDGAGVGSNPNVQVCHAASQI